MVRAFKATETVNVDGEDYTLAIDIAIIDALEDEFDLDFETITKQFQGKVRIGKLTRLIRGLLSRNHPELTLDEVGGLLMADSDAVGKGLERLFAKATPEAGEAKGENPPIARRGTGASSSSRGARLTSRRNNSGSKRLALSSSS